MEDRITACKTTKVKLRMFCHILSKYNNALNCDKCELMKENMILDDEIGDCAELTILDTFSD